MKSFLDLFVQICFKQHGCAQDIRESASLGAFEGKEEGRAKTSRYGNSIVQKMQVTRRSRFIQSLSGHVRINMSATARGTMNVLCIPGKSGLDTQRASLLISISTDLVNR